jgi:uncharacterized protein (DUF2147 family)
MQHRLFAPVLTAILAAGFSAQAFAADPSGVWAKDDGSAKMEVSKCGSGICAKIAWLRSPNDSRGRPLRDARNENVSMRDRPIMGLPIFKLAPAGANVWAGPVYNPEEGKIYSDVKVTLVSSRQLVLRGCKAMLFCGEKVWTRTSLPPSAAPEVEATEEVEAKAPAGNAPIEAKATAPAETPASKAAAAPEYIAPGVVATPAKQEALPLSGEDVPSMMVINKPASGSADNQATIAAGATEPAPPAPARAPETPVEQPQVAAAKPNQPAQVANQAAADEEAKPRAPVRQVQQAPRERLPWERPQGYAPSYLGFDRAPPPRRPLGGLFGGLFGGPPR